MGEAVEVSRDGNVYVILMNRPERLNALGYDVWAGLAEAFIEFRDDDSLRAAVLTGAGRAFCAGMDIKEKSENNSLALAFADIRPLVNPFWDTASMIRTTWSPEMVQPVHKPVIAAVNGPACGGGFYLAARSELCFAGHSAYFEVSEIRRGGQSGWHIALTEGLPKHIATELALGTRMSAQRMYDVGFVNKLLPDEELIDAAMEEAHRLASLPPLALAATMELISAARNTVPDAVMQRAAQLRREVFNSEDTIESLNAFLEHRAPVYRGR